MHTEATKTREITETELREAGGGAAYMKLGDIKGDVSASRATPILQLHCASGQF